MGKGVDLVIIGRRRESGQLPDQVFHPWRRVRMRKPHVTRFPIAGYSVRPRKLRPVRFNRDDAVN